MIGGICDIQKMLDLYAEHGFTAEVNIFRANEIEQAYERMLKGKVKYRFVMDIATMGG